MNKQTRQYFTTNPEVYSALVDAVNIKLGKPDEQFVHETWECNGIQYEGWRRKRVDLTEERKQQMSQNMQDYYLATKGHEQALKEKWEYADDKCPECQSILISNGVKKCCTIPDCSNFNGIF